ncbi:MAG: indoleacetamide hydrolase [Immundisolibacteraceae bacterium]|nr:indoleacetamide hydrolase [Immundisolibacteraceae bacterium]
MNSGHIADYPDIAGLSAAMEAGQVSSKSLVLELLSRVDQSAHLNAFITVNSRGAIEAAELCDQQRADGLVTGPLHGIPLAIKDNIHVAGLPNSAGTPSLKNFVPAANNEVVDRLQAAGAIILGKANLHELACGITSINATFGAVGNPFDETTFAGGSSGGTATAISAGLVPAGLGTDTGGSVRIPASLTGIVGFRPSCGRYPSSGVTPISRTRDTIGPMARSVSDIILIDQVVVSDEPPVSTIPASQIRLGVPRGYYYQNLDAETAEVIESGLSRLGDAGINLIECEVPDLEALLQQNYPLVGFEMDRDLRDYLQHFDTGVSFDDLWGAVSSPDVQGFLEIVTVTDDPGYQAAIAARELLRQAFQAYFDADNLDGMVFPTTVLPARSIETSVFTAELNGEQIPTFPAYGRNTDPGSAAALPGISLPVGLTRQGLPVGLEIDGPEQSDRQLLAVAKTLEAILLFDSRP